MKRLVALFLLIVTAVSFPVCAVASTESISPSIPGHVEQIPESEWHTDEFMVFNTGFNKEYYRKTAAPQKNTTETKASITVPGSEADKMKKENREKTAIAFGILLFMFSAFILFFAAIEFYWIFDHKKWHRGSKPNSEAVVADFSVRITRITNTLSRVVSTISFSDGYIFRTANYVKSPKNGNTTNNLYDDLKAKAHAKAEKAHNKAIMLLQKLRISVLSDKAAPAVIPVKVRPAFIEAKATAPDNRYVPSAIPDEDDFLDDFTLIKKVFHESINKLHKYEIYFDMQDYSWDMIKILTDHLIQSDLSDVSDIMAGSSTLQKKNITDSYTAHGGKCQTTPELEAEQSVLSITGISSILSSPVRIEWLNQAKTLWLFTLCDNELLIKRYAETILRRSFGTDDEMKLGIPGTGVPPATYSDTGIMLYRKSFMKWRDYNATKNSYILNGVMRLTEKQPSIYLYEDGVKTREYVLETEGDEDFTGKFFHFSVRISYFGMPAASVAQIDGFISDTREPQKMSLSQIGYRFEAYFLKADENSERRYEMIRGQELHTKGLKYPGYTTPTNIRLIGICPDCGKSFCFHGYAFYMGQSDIAYSDDGLDCCEIRAYSLDKDNWVYETEGKTFRYYNSFCCPHCGTPYIDYKKYPETKVFGASGCVFLNKKHYIFN